MKLEFLLLFACWLIVAVQCEFRPRIGDVFNGSLRIETIYNRLKWPDHNFYVAGMIGPENFPFSPRRAPNSKSLYNLKMYRQRGYMNVCVEKNGHSRLLTYGGSRHGYIENKRETDMNNANQLLFFALDKIASYIQMDFKYANRDCDITYLFELYRRNDGVAGVTYMETNRVFVYASPIPHLMKTVLHETWHALGFEHSDSTKSVLYYMHTDTHQLFYKMDIYSLIAAYGKRKQRSRQTGSGHRSSRAIAASSVSIENEQYMMQRHNNNDTTTTITTTAIRENFIGVIDGHDFVMETQKLKYNGCNQFESNDDDTFIIVPNPVAAATVQCVFNYVLLLVVFTFMF